MKISVLFFLLIPVMISCTSISQKEKENIALIESYIEAVENLDYQAMYSHLAEDYLGMGPDYGDSISREAAVENWKYVSENIYDKIDYRKSRNVAMTVASGKNTEEWVSNWAELLIRFKDGREVTIWANSIYMIENRKIVRSFSFYNEMDALRQLGYKVVSPEVD